MESPAVDKFAQFDTTETQKLENLVKPDTLVGLLDGRFLIEKDLTEGRSMQVASV